MASIRSSASATDYSQRFQLRVELKSGVPLYGPDSWGRRLGDLLVVKMLNVGTSTSYFQGIHFEALIDGAERNFHPLTWRDPILARMNPSTGAPIEPGRSLDHYYEYASFADIFHNGTNVQLTRVIVTDELGNTYAAEITEEFRRKIRADSLGTT